MLEFICLMWARLQVSSFFKTAVTVFCRRVSLSTACRLTCVIGLGKSWVSWSEKFTMAGSALWQDRPLPSYSGMCDTASIIWWKALLYVILFTVCWQISFKSNNATTAVIMGTRRHTANDILNVGNAVRNTIHDTPEKRIVHSVEESMKHGTPSALQEMPRRRGSRRRWNEPQSYLSNSGIYGIYHSGKKGDHNKETRV
jgi:hypothetical protein